MMFAVKKDGRFNGVAYEAVTEQIRAHHVQYGEEIVPVSGLVNTGSEDEPQWGVADLPASLLRASMVCSRMQARIAMHRAGLLSSVEAVISESDPVTQIAWADATEFRRDSQTILTIAASLDPPLTAERLDDLFDEAMLISA